MFIDIINDENFNCLKNEISIWLKMCAYVGEKSEKGNEIAIK